MKSTGSTSKIDCDDDDDEDDEDDDDEKKEEDLVPSWALWNASSQSASSKKYQIAREARSCCRCATEDANDEDGEEFDEDEDGRNSSVTFFRERCSSSVSTRR